MKHKVVMLIQSTKCSQYAALTIRLTSCIAQIWILPTFQVYNFYINTLIILGCYKMYATIIMTRLKQGTKHCKSKQGCYKVAYGRTSNFVHILSIMQE